MMRRLLNEAIWHTRRRSAFGAPLASQPAMVNVLADLALEAEAAVASSFRIVRAFDEGDRTFGRMALAVLKYWICKRGAPFAAEALECLGGNGYIETQQAPVAQFYRDIQIGTVWEGSGNVIALDVLRAMARSPESVDAFRAECELARGADARLDTHLDATWAALEAVGEADPQFAARALVEVMALAHQGSVLVRTGPAHVADAFCAARLAGRHRAFGTLPSGIDAAPLVDRALSA
jgi:putative acyl-CoA dehydrogenase